MKKILGIGLLILIIFLGLAVGVKYVGNTMNPTATITATNEPTNTVIPSATASPSNTATLAPTATETLTATPNGTLTKTLTLTKTKYSGTYVYRKPTLDKSTITPTTDIASNYCTNHGGKLVIIIMSDGSGNMANRCLFPNNIECGVWDYYYGKCNSATLTATNTPQKIYLPSNTPVVKVSNPASEYCISHGGTLQIRTSPIDGSQTGYCVSSSKECEEWAFYRGTCSIE